MSHKIADLTRKVISELSDYSRNDFDWSEVSLSPGDGWGEYVEEYEAALCVSLDIDHGYRWDTR